uniref:Putative secreted protein n=1 Tax=Ixodes ricinus TaxID=34613 RepID=A0A6B0U7Q6_IXORI
MTACVSCCSWFARCASCRHFMALPLREADNLVPSWITTVCVFICKHFNQRTGVFGTSDFYFSRDHDAFSMSYASRGGCRNF